MVIADHRVMSQVAVMLCCCQFALAHVIVTFPLQAFTRKFPILTHIAWCTGYHQIAHVIGTTTTQRDNVINMMFTPFDFMLTVVTFALLPRILFLDLLCSMRSISRTFMSASV